MTPAPLNITLSIGNVSFHLTPSPHAPTNDDTPIISSPTPTSSSRKATNISAGSSPYGTHKKRHHMKRSGILTPRSLNIQNKQQQQQYESFSPPIVAIRHGSTAATPSNINTLSPAGGTGYPASPQSPLQQHIRGRVRAMKNKIEQPPTPTPQAPLFSSTHNNTSHNNGSNSSEYCVDLNGFTGTLYITSSKGGNSMPSVQQSTPLKENVCNTSEQNNSSTRRRIITSPRLSKSFRRSSIMHPEASPSLSSSRKRFTRDEALVAEDKHAFDTSLVQHSKRRNTPSSTSSNTDKNGFTWIASSDNDEVEVGRVSDAYQYENNDLFNNLSEESAMSVSQVINVNNMNTTVDTSSSKTVRFSLLAQNSIIDPLALDDSIEASPSKSSLNGDVENQTSTAIVPAAQSPQQQLQQISNKPMSKYFFSSPPTCRRTFTSPPKAGGMGMTSLAKNTLRETSTKLAKSSKHVLKQVTLAGKDVYDVLSNGDNGYGDSRQGSDAASNSDVTGILADHNGSVRNNANGDNNEEVYDAFDGAELHYACASHNLHYIERLLEYPTSLDDLHKVDCTGKLPIHLLVENTDLITSDPMGCEDVAFTMLELMGPEKAIQSLHPNGLAVFVNILGLWTETLHRDVMFLRNSMMKGSVSVRLSMSGGNNNKVAGEQSGATSSSDNEQQPVSSLNTSPTRPRRLPYRSLFTSALANDKSLVSSIDRAKLLYLPTCVTIPAHVRWAIHILSRLIDEYPEQTRESILTNVASVPLFLKSVLLVADVDEMTELLDTTLVKHTVVDKRSINVWLCAMLTDTREVKIRAVTFIKLLSKLTLQDLAATSQSPNRYSDKEVDRFTTLREDVFNAVYVMPGIVPAVLELGGHVIENISTTRVMRYITERTIRKESVFFVLILDFFYSIFLLMGYRLNVEFVLNYQDVDGPDAYREHSFISSSTMGIAGYFLVKNALTLLSLYLTSTKLAKRYCLSIFNIIDVASVAMLLGTESILSTDPTLLDNDGFAASLTIILLWLKLLFAFKVLNSAFALYLYAVNEVIKEIKWFILFLFTVVLMFSDAARTIVAARGDCQYNVDGNQYVAEEFCSDQLSAVVIRMYSVLVGDVALEYFQSSDAMVAVFVFFTFFSIIIRKSV